ncbi:MAG: carbohydrate ABC transporter permease [Actinobacteria bacterium]|nr:carbohydrate ABC transporter permease [Actinomycetota bacterium]
MFKLTIKQFLFTRLAIIISLAIVILPLMWIFFLSLKRPNELFQSILFFFPKHITFMNYPAAINFSKDALSISFVRMYLNSTIATSGGLIISILAASFAAFSMVHYKFKFKEIYYTFILVCQMLPVQLLLIPLYIVLWRMRFLNTYAALIFPYATIGIPVATIVLRRFFEQIPLEIVDSAKIDGASDFQIYKNLYLPLATPALATAIIFLFLQMWNEFLFALVFINSDNLQTLPLALSKLSFGGKEPVPLNVYTAMIVISVIPILIIFMIFQKWMVRGLVEGSIKG